MAKKLVRSTRALWVLIVASYFTVVSCSKNDGGQSNPIPPVNTAPVIIGFTPDSGAAGVAVTVSGKNFSSNSSEDIITFNGVPATISNATTTEISTVVPVGATSGKIVLKVKGVSTSSTKDFEILQTSWIRKTDFPGGLRGFAGGFAIGNKAFLLTGITPFHGAIATDLQEYDETSNTWTQKADFPGGPRQQAIGFSIGGLGYFGMGNIYGNPDPATEHNDLWSYDPALDKWTKKADLPSSSREDAIAFTIGNKAYLGLGTHGGSFTVMLRDLWEYDPSSDSWSRKADFPGAATIETVAFSENGYGYVGLGADVAGVFSKEFWQFDPLANTWTRKNDFTTDGREGGVGVSINGIGYIGFGSNPSKIYGDFWKYDATADHWLLQTKFPGGSRAFPVLLSIGNKGYFGTGYDSTSNGVKDFWQFNP